MRRPAFPLVLLLAAAAAGAAPPGDAPRKAPRLAAWSIRAVSGVSPATATILTEVVAAELTRVTGAQVMSSADVTAMLGFDRQRQALGCTEPRCLAELGTALKVDYLVTGQVGAMGSRYHLSLTLVDSSSGSVVNRVAGFCDPSEDALASAAQSSVAALVRPLSSPASAGTSGAATAAAAGPGAAPEPALDAETGSALLARAAAKRAEAPAEAAALYDEYLRRFPAGEDRCTAAMMAGVGWESGGDAGKAADRYVAFATERCGAQAPDVAAKLLHRAGGIYSDLGRRSEARRVWRTLAALEGVTDAAMLRKIDSVRLRLQAEGADGGASGDRGH